MSLEIQMMLVMLVVFVVTSFGIGVPVAFSIGLSTIAATMMMFPFEQSILIVAQKMITGVDNFAFLALPFFMLAGNIMRVGGIADKLINVALLLVGRLPGALSHTNIVANTMFGTVSGSAIGSAAAVGGVMVPAQKAKGYDPAFATAVNIASCPIGMIIPPSGALITYSLLSGGTSIAGLFLAGYIPGLLIALSLMFVTYFLTKRKGYPQEDRITFAIVVRTLIDALPALGLVVIILGGIIGGIFTATEASAIAVVYSLGLAMFYYKQLSFSDIPKVFGEAMLSATVILILIGISSSMSWTMSIADIPYMVGSAMLGVSENPVIVLLLINILLLFIGVFMDGAPAKLIFIPILLPIVTQFGMDPIQFGILITFNLCIGLCTPPVGTALFAGCKIGDVPVASVIKPLVPLWIAQIAVLMLITYVPWVTMWLPNLFGYGL